MTFTIDLKEVCESLIKVATIIALEGGETPKNYGMLYTNTIKENKRGF